MAGGRPKIEWGDKEFRTFEALCGIHCTEQDICSVMNVTDKTLNNILKKKYKMSFSECFKRFSANGRISLRKKQFEVAKAGNVTMLIWLGKQHLGQADRIGQETHDNSEGTHDQLIMAIRKITEEDDTPRD